MGLLFSCWDFLCPSDVRLANAKEFSFVMDTIHGAFVCIEWGVGNPVRSSVILELYPVLSPCFR